MTKKKTAWKPWELYICRLLGGQRRGADYGDRSGGKNDCVGTPGFSVETKIMARPTFSIMLSDAKKAIERKENPTDIGISIMRKKGLGSRLDDTLVCMTLREFTEFYVSNEENPPEN